MRGSSHRDRNDSEKTCETQGLAGPDDKPYGSEQVGTNQVSLNYWRQSVWPQCLPYTSTNENHWKAGSEGKGACVKNQNVLR